MLSLFVNGDSHTARVYGRSGKTATEILAEKYHCQYQNIAYPGGSNQRIIRTTIEALPNLDPKSTVIIIGWSSFERTEWYYKDQWHQICGDEKYAVDAELKNLGRQHLDAWYADDNHECWRRQADQHHSIWVFHKLLHQLGYEFLFYQGCKTFFFDGCPQQDMEFKLPWIEGTWVHDPYVKLTSDGQRIADSFSHHAESLGFSYADDRAHYGADAHQSWADYLDPLINQKISGLLGADNESKTC